MLVLTSVLGLFIDLQPITVVPVRANTMKVFANFSMKNPVFQEFLLNHKIFVTVEIWLGKS